MKNEKSIMNDELKEMYMELMGTIDEMDGDDKCQVEESKAVLRALMEEAFEINYM